MPFRLFRRLRAALRPERNGRAAAPFVLHDDMFEDWEILPASAAGWCVQQFAEIAQSAAQHETPGGTGWTDMHVRAPAPASAAEMDIPYVPAIAAIGGLLPEFTQTIASGFSDPRPRPIHGRAFGPSPLAAIVVYHDQAQRTVRHIAVTLRGNHAERASVLGALAAIPAREPFLIVDWARGLIARLDRLAERETFLRRDAD
jgi:hypothetical protein